MKKPFRLDEAIAAWRREIADADTLRAIDIAELETHLRDGYADLRACGLADDEAFLIARRRLGATEGVAEFAKVNPDSVWVVRAKWMLLGVLGFEVFWSGLNIVSTLIQIGVERVVTSPAGVIWNQGLTTLSTLAIFAFVLSRLVRGKWRLGALERFVALLHPVVLAVCVGAMFLVEKALRAMQMVFTTHTFGSYGFARTMIASTYLNHGLAFVTLILLAVASAVTQRRTASVK